MMSAERGKTQTPTMDGMPLKVKNNEAEMDWNKDHIRETMLSLETAALQSARKKYLDYVSTARLDRSEPIENDEQAQAERSADLAEAFDDLEHEASAKLAAIAQLDFGPRNEVAPGAAVKIGDRYLVIGVSTGEFTCQGQKFVGISQAAPIYAALEGKTSGETCEFRGRVLRISEIY